MDNNKYQIKYIKWKEHTKNIRDHLRNSQMGVCGNINLVFTKHFIQRLQDRISFDEEDIIRKMFYHTINTKLCSLLFWYYSKHEQNIMLIYKRFRIIISRGNDEKSMIVRTFYIQRASKDVKIDEVRNFVIELG